MVPIALVNDHHFWGVIESGPELAIEPVDKGELAVFRSQREVKTSEADISFEDGESPEVAFPHNHHSPGCPRSHGSGIGIMPCVGDVGALEWPE